VKVDFDQIKKSTDIVRVVESYGITLKKVGRDHVGLCPFHDDHSPSLRVTQARGLFRCPACQATGNVIQFVAKKEGISERDAAMKILGAVPGVQPASQVVAPPATITETPPGLTAAEDSLLLQRVVTFYTRTLHKDRAGLDYLKGRRLDDPAMLETFQVGFSNGSLLGAVPKEGELVQALKDLGVLKANGREHFEGCVTVPLFSLPDSSPEGANGPGDLRPADRGWGGEAPVPARPASRCLQRGGGEVQSLAFHL
jgi:DNA primase